MFPEWPSLAAGVEVSEITHRTPGLREEMRLTDPDGYTLMVAQTEIMRR